MKIQICSDLHLEFYNNRKWIEENPLIPSGDILIIAGDTYYLGEKFNKLDFIKKVSDDFEETYIIPGNHEYYNGFDVYTAKKATEEKIKENVRMINNKTVTLYGVKFIFSTMWSKIDRNILAIMRGMTDFRKIKYKKERFLIDHFNQIHEESFKFIEKEVKGEGKKIVATHHLPSTKCIVERLRESPLNQAFCVDKTDFITNSEINYWIYGHSHGNKNDFKINKTMMVTNQLGYVGKGEHLSFKQDKVIELETLPNLG